MGKKRNAEVSYAMTTAVPTEIVEPAIPPVNLDALLEDAPVATPAETTSEPEIVSEAVLERAVVAAETRDEYAEAPASTVTESSPPAAPVEATPAKKARTPRVYHATPSAKIDARIGGKRDDYLVLETSDAALSATELAAKHDSTMKEIDALAKKVGEKAAQLFGYLARGGSLNEVMERGFRVLCADGYMTSGDKGNVQANLLAKPYSLGTARSQSNQLFCLFPALKITVRDGKGRQIPNPESTILARVKKDLGL